MIYGWMVMITAVAVYFAIRFFLLRRSLRELGKDFDEICQDRRAERHVQITSPDKELERLAEGLNQYIAKTYQDADRQKQQEKEVRREITNLSHDLRTPLTSILGYLDLLEDGNITETEREEYQAIISRRGHNLNDLIQQLYDYARLENEDFPMELCRVDLHQLLQEHLLELYEEFEDKNIRMEIQLGEDPVWIQSNPEALRRIFQNLSSNVLKYGDSAVQISLETAGKGAIVKYRNLAEGLTETDTARMFERFYRKDPSRSRQSSGLGLTITKLLVQRLGGSICAKLDGNWLEITCKL